MFNFNLKATLQALVDGSNSLDTPGPPSIADPNKGVPNPNQNPAAQLPSQIGTMLNNSNSQRNGLVAKEDKTPLEYSGQDVELTATAIPEKEAPKVAEKKGFKANLMDDISKQFKGGSNIEKANNQKGNSGPDTSLQEDRTKRPQPPTMHTPPMGTPPNPKISPTLPPDPSIPKTNIPQSGFPKVAIPKFKGPRF